MIMFVLTQLSSFRPPLVCVCIVCVFECARVFKMKTFVFTLLSSCLPPRVCVRWSVCIVFGFECMCVCERECAQIDGECVSECV